MTPIRELLNRIRWDADFARGEFELGYFDRVERRVIVVPFRDINFPTDAPEVFQLVDREGQVHRIPLHRVREMRKDGQRIWHRFPSRENRTTPPAKPRNSYEGTPVAAKKDVFLPIPVKRKRCVPGKL